jgi:hypothetical protein
VPEGKSCKPCTDQLMKHLSEKDGQSIVVNFAPEIYGGTPDYLEWISPQLMEDEVYEDAQLGVSVISVYNR